MDTRWRVCERLDSSLQVLETTIRIVYNDITRLEVDALVSTDDVHLSRSEQGGVAEAIRAAAGSVPREDARKHPLPLPLGSVLVTSAGQLSAKYIFHALTFEFNTRPSPETLIPQVMRRVLGLAAALQIERLALPILLSQGTDLSKAQTVMMMLREIAGYLIGAQSALRQITIANYKSGVADHAAVEQRRLEELRPACQQIARWAEELAPLNSRMALLGPLLAVCGDDGELRHILEARIAADRRALLQIFGGTPLSDAGAPGVERHDSVPRSQQEYDQAQRQLTMLLDDLAEEVTHLSDLQRIQRRRLHSLERQRAHRNNDADPAIMIELEDIERSIDQRAIQIQKIQDQQAAAQRDLDTLQRNWQRRG